MKTWKGGTRPASEHAAGNLRAIVIALAFSASSALADVSEIVDLSVNVNRSLVPCLTDGARYTLSGHIVGPRAAMRDGAAATLCLHGAVVPEATWRMAVP